MCTCVCVYVCMGVFESMCKQVCVFVWNICDSIAHSHQVLHETVISQFSCLGIE